jgi:hypothetical protein
MVNKPDFSYLAVRRQLNGMAACAPFEIGIRDAANGRMMSRTWSREEIFTAFPWLKLQNLKGADIYIRAAHEGTGLVLVDDVTLASIERMKSDGLSPAVLVETSQANYQVWIMLTTDTLATPLATACAKALAKRYQGDPASADWHHYGRLAGFTNQKPVRVTDTGHHPWVLCHEANGKTAVRGAEFVHAVEQAAIKKTIKPIRQTQPPPHSSSDNVRAEFTRQWRVLTARYGSEFDSSRADFMICRSLLQKFSRDEVADALRNSSDMLFDRKVGHVDDYITRTVAAAEAAFPEDDE